MLEDLNRFVELRAVQPTVDRVFSLSQATKVYAHFGGGRHFGKLVIRLSNKS
jgi:NADPH:quinone reductase-like Zn-dependent oxidoreductase